MGSSSEKGFSPSPMPVRIEVEKNYRWNFTVNTLDGAFFWFGSSFFSSEIILTLFVSHFTRNPIIIGLLGFLGWGGVLLPQLFVANAVERSPVKKFFPMTLGFFLERLPILLLAPLIYLSIPSPPAVMLVVFYLLYTWHNIGAGVIIVGWQDMIAKVIPVEKRGRFFGISNFIGNATGILGALLVPFIFDKNDFPLGFILCFAVTGVFYFLSWASLSLTREIPDESAKPPVTQKKYLSSLPRILEKDRNFSRFLLSQVIFSLSGMAVSFITIYLVDVWNTTDAEASGYIIAMQAGLCLANIIFGFLSDRRGHKLTLEICWMLRVIALALVVFSPGLAWFYLVFFLTGMVSAGTLLSGFSIVYEFTDAQNRPTYIGLSNTIPGIVIMAAPMIGAWLVGVFSYRLMFIFAAFTAALGWLLLRFTVCEPRTVGAQEIIN